MTFNSEALVGSFNEEKHRVFHFCIFGLSARNEALLQSMVRLLKGVTQHEWTYAADGRDLVVAGFGDPRLPSVKADLLLYAPADTRARLWIGDGDDAEQFSVSLPLDFKQLRAAFDQVSAWLEAQQALRIADAKIHMAEHALGCPQLLRWPPVDVLSSPERKKAAAILLKGPVDVASVARRSGMELGDCERFIASLPHVQWTERQVFRSGPHPAPGHESAPHQALGRIAAALPDAPAPPGSAHDKRQAAVTAPFSWVRSGGFLALIRSRLGLAP